MSDTEAARIIEIATRQGKRFRTAIDKIRADGINYATDTSYNELVDDLEREVVFVDPTAIFRPAICRYPQHRQVVLFME